MQPRNFYDVHVTKAVVVDPKDEAFQQNECYDVYTMHIMKNMSNIFLGPTWMTYVLT